MAQGGTALKTTKVTNLDASPPLKAAWGESGGRLHAWYDTITLASATAPYITMARVEPGARISPNSRLRWAALGSSTTLSVGDQYVSNRFKIVTATATASFAVTTGLVMTTVCEWFDGVDSSGAYKYTCEQDIRVYTADQSYTGAVTLWLEYTLGD